MLPRLACIEDDASVEGLLVLLNTSGGDVDAGLAIAEMIASLSLPTVSLVSGRQPLHRRTARRIHRLLLHRPLRHHDDSPGTDDGNGHRHRQTYEYFEMIQDRILTFVSTHANIAYDQLRDLMHNTKMLTRDLGTVLVGQEAVEAYTYIYWWEASGRR